MSLYRPVTLLLRWIYRFDEPKVVRDRPMQVLALGLSRCATESLKFALEDLGYQGVYHGFEIKADQCMVWTRLWDAKAAGSGRKIGVEDFDKLIGNYEAITDAPGTMFAKELIEAYPDAKVFFVINGLVDFLRLISNYEGHSQPPQRCGRVGPKLPLDIAQRPS